jgi:hypothetical protein
MAAVAATSGNLLSRFFLQSNGRGNAGRLLDPGIGKAAPDETIPDLKER